MIVLRRMTPADIPTVEQIKVAAAQVCFAGTSADFLSDNNLKIDKHLITQSGDIVGYFKIDTGYFDNYSFCHQDALGLRAFVVSINHQHQGIGKRAIQELQPYLVKLYPTYKSVFLTVNVKNIGARKCYLNSGFEDTGQLYLGGSAGPQHIMCMVFG